MADQRITVDPHQMGGAPRIGGLRIPVATAVGRIADGMPKADILATISDLEAEDIREALPYAAEAVRERELPPPPPCMRFPIDNALLPKVADGLLNAGDDATHVMDIGLAAAADAQFLRPDRRRGSRPLSAAHTGCSREKLLCYLVWAKTRLPWLNTSLPGIDLCPHSGTVTN